MRSDSGDSAEADTGLHVLTLDVRDYECDIEGIVNNAVYLNYFEHARHTFLKSHGTSFLDLHRRGFDPVVVRVEIDYKAALSSGDSICIHTKMRTKGRFRFIFDQHIIRASDHYETTRATVIGTFIRDGKPIMPPAEILQNLGAE